MFDFEKVSTPVALMDELERFIVFWLGPRLESYGEPETSLSQLCLPEPLRRLYAFAGRWPSLTSGDEMCEKYGWMSIFSTQDMLLRPNRLTWSEDGSKVQFVLENQGVWSLATQSSGDDPPVWIDSDELGFEECAKWPKANDSLAHVLTTFCLQELTFGAKFGVWDEDLSELFRSGEPKITPIWLNGTYVWPGHEYNFYLMDDDVLVGQFGDDDSFFFGANSETGIARIQKNESPIVSVTLSTPTNWNLKVDKNGSGEVGVFMSPDSSATFPNGTFKFESLLDELILRHLESGDYRTTPIVFFHRSGRGYADGKGLPDWELVQRLLNQSIAAVENKEARFDSCLQSVPFQ